MINQQLQILSKMIKNPINQKIKEILHQFHMIQELLIKHLIKAQ